MLTRMTVRRRCQSDQDHLCEWYRDPSADLHVLYGSERRDVPLLEVEWESAFFRSDSNSA